MATAADAAALCNCRPPASASCHNGEACSAGFVADRGCESFGKGSRPQKNELRWRRNWFAVQAPTSTAMPRREVLKDAEGRRRGSKRKKRGRRTAERHVGLCRRSTTLDEWHHQARPEVTGCEQWERRQRIFGMKSFAMKDYNERLSRRARLVQSRRDPSARRLPMRKV